MLGSLVHKLRIRPVELRFKHAGSKGIIKWHLINQGCLQAIFNGNSSSPPNHNNTLLLNNILQKSIFPPPLSTTPDSKVSTTELQIPKSIKTPHFRPFSLSFRIICSGKRIDNGEDEHDEGEDIEDDAEEDSESDVEGCEDNDDSENADAGKTEEQKAQEAAEIGYKVIGPLQSSDRVFKHYQPVFAVVQIGSHQFKVSNGDSIFTEKLKYCDVNDKLILNRVLMLGSAVQTVIGRPVLPQASVHAVVEEHALDAKVIIFKKKRRKNYRRTKGHRQELTKLRITDIRGIGKPKTKTSLKTNKTAEKQEAPVSV